MGGVGSKRYAYGAVGLLLLLVVLKLPPVVGIGDTYRYLGAAGWCAVIAAMLLALPRMHTPGRISLRERIAGYAFSGAVVFLALNFAAAVLMKNLAATPYDLSPMGVVRNMIGILPALVGREMIRAYALGAIWRRARHPLVGAAVVTMVLAVTEMNLLKMSVLQTAESWFVFVAKDILPVAAKNILLSVLAVYGGVKSAVIYGAVIAVFMRVFPFLPSLPWIAESGIGIVFPIMLALFVREKYQIMDGVASTREEGSTVGFGAALILSVLFAWFAIGVFPVYPSVVLTGSMEPDIRPGDVVLVKKLTEEKEVYQLKEDDVIHFRRENITIIHRIIDIRQDEAGNVSFQTKGDNNSVPDEEIVMPNDLKGIVLATVPKVGQPLLWLKSMDEIPEGVVQ